MNRAPACTILSALLIAIASSLCLSGCEASGRVERISPHRLAPQPPEAVELYFDGREPQDRYHVVARIETEASTRRFVTIQEAEAAAYDKLRALAGRAGARAVIDISQSVEHETADSRDAVGHQVVKVHGTAIVFRR